MRRERKPSCDNISCCPGATARSTPAQSTRRRCLKSFSQRDHGTVPPPCRATARCLAFASANDRNPAPSFFSGERRTVPIRSPISAPLCARRCRANRLLELDLGITSYAVRAYRSVLPRARSSRPCRRVHNARPLFNAENIAAPRLGAGKLLFEPAQILSLQNRTHARRLLAGASFCPWRTQNPHAR